MPLFVLATVAGVLTVLAPCILSVLPIVLGTSGRSKWRPVAIVSGFIGSFSAVGAAFVTAGTLLGASNEALRAAAASLLIVFGLALLFESVYDAVSAKLQVRLSKASAAVAGKSLVRSDALSGLLVGLALGLVWTPCAGPILGAILTLAVQTQEFLTTFFLLLAYAVGAAVPMLGIAYGGQWIQKGMRRFGKWQGWLNKVFGLIVIAMAVLILTGYDLVLQAKLVRYYPAFLFKL
jgi:cytochrome c biogenesis protein CcdA